LHETPSPKLLKIAVRSFFFENCSDIHKSRCTTGTTGVVDAGGQYATGVNDTGGKFAAGVNDTSGK
jgi:hypothetical protein